MTYVGQVDNAGRAMVDKEPMTISELHRSGQMMPVQGGYPATERSAGGGR